MFHRMLVKAGYLPIVSLVAAWLLPLTYVVYRAVSCGGASTTSSVWCSVSNFASDDSALLVIAILNSFVVGLITAALTLLLASALIIPGLAKDGTWYHLLAPAVALRCIPPIALLIPHTVMVDFVPAIRKSAWLLASFHSLIALPLALLIIIPRLQRLHRNDFSEGGLFDLARLDGLSSESYLLRILLPNLKSEFLLAGVIAFSVSWGELLYSGVFRVSSADRTLPVFISTFETGYEILWTSLFVATAFSCIIVTALAAVVASLLNREMISDD
jgi:trehalose/maltose transport system permease protein